MEDAYGREKAAKNDNAEVSILQWGIRLLEHWAEDPGIGVRLEEFRQRFQTDALTVIRGAALRRWRHNLFRSFKRYMIQWYPEPWCVRPAHDELAMEWHKDVRAMVDCFTRAAGASWWDWDHGSRLFFWRWPSEARHWARDGLPIYYQEDLLPWYRTRQPSEPDKDVRQKVRFKLDKFRERGYIRAGTARSLTPYFTVPKGDGDVRVVFDGTKSKLNEALWAPPLYYQPSSLYYAVSSQARGCRTLTLAK